MQYQIKKPRKLNDREVEDIQNIVSICKRCDNLDYTFDPGDDYRNDSDINTFLLYDKDMLLSVITLFVPGKREAEVSAFTLPEFRRKGLFSKLLNEVKIEITRRGIPDLLFVCDRNSRDGMNVLDHINASYEYSEYTMKLNPQKISDFKADGGLQIRTTIPNDKPDLTEINMKSFNNSKEEADNFVNEAFLSDKRIAYTVLYHKKIIGMIGIYSEENRYYIYGFCIDPEYRNRGLGGQTLKYIAKKYYDTQPKKDIVLEVQVDNVNALSLYKTAGFQIITTYDYLRLPINGK